MPDNYPCDLVSQCFLLTAPFRGMLLTPQGGPRCLAPTAHQIPVYLLVFSTFLCRAFTAHYLYTPRSFDIPPGHFHGAPIACHNQRGLSLWPTNDHISSISASSPARSMATAISSGLWVRRNAVFTDSRAASFFLSSRNTVSVLIRSTRAVSRTPLALRLMSMIWCFTAGSRPRYR